MKKGNELGIEPLTIKLKGQGLPNKAINHIYAINDILYDNSKRYISPAMAKRIYDTLCAEASALKETNVPTSDTIKMKVLEELRTLCKNLISYSRKYQWTENDVAAVKSTISYQVSMYLKEREDEGFNVLAYLKRNKEVWEEMYLPCPSHNQIDVRAFCKMQKELLVRLETLLQLTEPEAE